jgi:anti-sigma regulatory factor (Ser/Thr protein kinase)
VIPADPAAIQTVTDGVLQALQNKPGVAGHEYEIELALQEALANAIRHGCKGDRTKSVQCCVTYEEGGDVLIVVRDPGPGFDVSRVPSTLDANVFEAHGCRIFLINQLMDESLYRQRPGASPQRNRPSIMSRPDVRDGSAVIVN